MIRTLDASDFIEIKEKRPASPDSSVLVMDVSLTKTNKIKQHRELFGIKGILCQKAKGAVIYREGESGSSFYLLQKGSIALHVNQGMIVESVKPSELFGVESVFSKNWLATAVVNDDAELYEFKNSDLTDSIDFIKGSELLKIVEQAYTKERTRLLLYEISPFIGINEDELKDITKGIVIMPFKKGQIMEPKDKEGIYIVSEGKMILVGEDISDSANSVYQYGDIICKPLFKLAGEEDGELLKLNEEFVQRITEISEPFKSKISAEMKRREKYIKPASDKQKSAEPAAHVISDNEQKPPAVTENKSDIKKEKNKEGLNTHEIRLFLSASSVFGSIGLEEKSKIAKCAELACFDKNQDIIKAGTFGEGKFYIIKKGQVKIIKANSRGNIITVGWLEEGDFLGEQLLIYNVGNNETIISLTNIELLAIDNHSFRGLYDYYPDFKKAIINRLKERAIGFSEIENNLKALSVMNFMIENGLTYAANLKIYELNKCINCFSCVKACKERHGMARFKRVGPKYSYASVPQSCRTCKHPTCLSKCRKGAIMREENGEIAINSKCVGCGLCAKSCSFGAIEVIESEIVNGKSKRKAVKCEHCRGFKDCACVSECPTGAIKHVDPRAYFKHLLTQQEAK
ncbi:MAG: cyclic nucleotide-binding domain-containing protein [Nitrospirae bacterium]|nr:cyclic nucleotide-binding domain-containing protein [Nitrospirota bacterium]